MTNINKRTIEIINNTQGHTNDESLMNCTDIRSGAIADISNNAPGISNSLSVGFFLTAESLRPSKRVATKVIPKTTDASIKGQPVSSSYKPAVLENNLNVQVPPFIEIGDEIIIDSRSLEYIKKV